MKGGSYQTLKEAASKAPLLASYRSKASTRISADASSFGLGSVIEQFNGTRWYPVVDASRALIETENHYAQIEKEAPSFKLSL